MSLSLFSVDFVPPLVGILYEINVLGDPESGGLTDF
jgi:hypothetical protein